MTFLEKINQIVDLNKEKISDWFVKKESEVSLPFYTSVDLRVSENKITAVDTNIFPGGFNNLCATFIDQAAKLTRDFKSESHSSKIKKVLIVPEFHTRNNFYWDNILSLVSLLSRSPDKVE